ncbi:hypothetical protein M432DRAFT_592831 [Thermoascus aurantiacus ATCC 26904]
MTHVYFPGKKPSSSSPGETEYVYTPLERAGQYASRASRLARRDAEHRWTSIAMRCVQLANLNPSQAPILESARAEGDSQVSNITPKSLIFLRRSQAPIVEIDISGTDATAPAANSRGKHSMRGVSGSGSSGLSQQLESRSVAAHLGHGFWECQLSKSPPHIRLAARDVAFESARVGGHPDDPRSRLCHAGFRTRSSVPGLEKGEFRGGAAAGATYPPPWDVCRDMPDGDPWAMKRRADGDDDRFGYSRRK